AQRYEGASTIFGPHTLEAYKQQYQKLAKALVSKTSLPPGPTPPNFIKKQISLQPGVIFDGTTKGRKFGQVLENAKASYNVGSRVSIKFVVANPRNDLFTDKTFLTVERLDSKSNTWIVVANDGCWETQYHWKRTNVIVGESEATVIWDIPKDTVKGDYRIKVFGVSKNAIQTKTKFTGTSNIFKVM
ncbi:Neutral ceramidase-like protein, partial [Leptotrombidium deliense]